MNKIPYRGERTIDDFKVEYSMQRIIFTVYYKGQKLSWEVGKLFVKNYPNFHRISERDLHEFYDNYILPKVHEYFKFMNHYAMMKSPDFLS
jgi:hypothetical protein